ncbi:MAG: flagellar export protein FliJ [Pirellulaceae bacterium]
MAETFRLATLLRIHEDRRDALREELAEADQAIEILRGQIGEVEQSTLAAMDELRSASQGSVNVDWLSAQRRHAFVLRLHKSELLRQTDVVQEERERRRVALMEADREVRKFERMREQWAERVAETERKRDQSRMDELSIIGFHHSRGEEGDR